MSKLLACLAMLVALIVVAALATRPATSPVAGPSPTAPTGPIRPGEFKLTIAYDALDRSQRERGEIFFGNGRSYEFLDGSDEVVVVEPARSALRLVDLRRQAQTEISYGTLDAAIEQIRAESRAVIAAGVGRGRAEQVAAGIERDLLEPRFAIVDDPATGRILLRNPTVQAAVKSLPEADKARLRAIFDALTLDAELRAVRQPETFAPFAQVDALNALLVARQRLPTEMLFTFRLEAEPRQYRWTYGFVPVLTQREREALGRVDTLIATAKRLPFEGFGAEAGP